MILLFYDPKEDLSMTRSRRKNFTAQEKLTAVLRHLIDKVPVSDLCDELGVQPTQE